MKRHSILYRSLLALLFVCMLAAVTGCGADKLTNPGQQDSTVYITETGTKYHRGDCSYLNSSKIAISCEDAHARGYTACSRCKPKC